MCVCRFGHNIINLLKTESTTTTLLCLLCLLLLVFIRNEIIFVCLLLRFFSFCSLLKILPNFYRAKCNNASCTKLRVLGGLNFIQVVDGFNIKVESDCTACFPLVSRIDNIGILMNT